MSREDDKSLIPLGDVTVSVHQSTITVVEQEEEERKAPLAALESIDGDTAAAHLDGAQEHRAPTKKERSGTNAAGGLNTLSLFSWLSPRLLAIIFFALLFVWIYGPEGGIGVMSNNLFGLHALLMSLFVVVFLQESVLSFAAPLIPFRSRLISKYFHISQHVLGLASAIGGLVAIVYYKQLSDQPIAFPFFTMYSPHSWVAIVFLALWIIQLVFSSYFHFIAKLRLRQIRVFKAYHAFLGRVVYAVGMVTCALGFQDMQASDLCPVPMSSQASNSTGSMSGMSGMSMGIVRVLDTMTNGSMTNSTGSSMGASSGSGVMLGESYDPYSDWARYASAASIILCVMAVATFATHIKVK